jgi:hypothetical protein
MKVSTMGETDLLKRALDVLGALVWCHQNERTHLLSLAAFERLKNETWTSAIQLQSERQISPGDSSWPAPAAITHEEMAKFLAEAIQIEISDEGALVWKARLKESGDPEVPLAGGETPETVGTLIWERGDTGEIALAAKNCGAILAYFHVARHYDIALPPEVTSLEEWGDTINPA